MTKDKKQSGEPEEINRKTLIEKCREKAFYIELNDFETDDQAIRLDLLEQILIESQPAEMTARELIAAMTCKVNGEEVFNGKLMTGYDLLRFAEDLEKEQQK